MHRFFSLLLLVAACAGEEEPSPVGPILVLHTDQIDFGSAPCTDERDAHLAVENVGDEEVKLVVSSDLPEVTVEYNFGIRVAPRQLREIGVVAHFRSRANELQSGNITLESGTTSVQVPITMRATGANLFFEPSELDFGDVLPNTTRDLTLVVSTDEPGADVPVDLSSSTPRFEVIGATSGLVSAGNDATFTVRYIASDLPFHHERSLAIEPRLGVCAFAGIPLKGTTVP